MPPSAFGRIFDKLEQGQEICKVFLLAGHGQVALGHTLQEALFLAELIEETVQVAVLSSFLAAPSSG